MRETIIGQKSLLFVNQITMGRLHCSLAPVLCGLPFLLSKFKWGIILMSDMSCIALLELDVTQTQLNRWKHDLAFVWCFELENRPLSFSLPHTLAWLVSFSPQNGLLFPNEETYRDMKCGFETQHYKSDFLMFPLPKYQFFSNALCGDADPEACKNTRVKILHWKYMWWLPWELHPCAQYKVLSHPSPVPLPLQLGLCVLFCGSDWAISFQNANMQLWNCQPKPSGVCNDCSDKAVKKCMIIRITLLQVYIVNTPRLYRYFPFIPVPEGWKGGLYNWDLMSMGKLSERGGCGSVIEVVWGASWIMEWEVTQDIQTLLPPMEETHCLWFPFSQHALDFS